MENKSGDNGNNGFRIVDINVFTGKNYKVKIQDKVYTVKSRLKVKQQIEFLKKKPLLDTLLTQTEDPNKLIELSETIAGIASLFFIDNSITAEWLMETLDQDELQGLLETLFMNYYGNKTESEKKNITQTTAKQG